MPLLSKKLIDMKKVFFLTTLWLFFSFGLSAQTKAGDNEKAKALIEQAKKYASEEEYAPVATYLQEAYDINPSLFDCYATQLLGVSYYMMEESELAIKFLELTVKCENNKETLAKIYLYLSDSYLEVGNYKQAVISSEKSIFNNTDEKAKSIIYEELANIHYDNKGGDKAIESMQKSVAHLLKHLSITENDVMRGSVKNEALGKSYFTLTWFASALANDTVMLESVVKSALCGNKNAISFCNKNKIDYKDAIKVGDTSVKATEEVLALIKQAAALVVKKEYSSAVSQLEKAHILNPTLFTGKTYHLMGLSYFMLSKHQAAINYFERALQFDLNKKDLYFIYGILADAYKIQKDYTNASKNAEKALYLANGDDDILKCSLRLASIYFAQENFDSTIDSYENAIKYYMKIHAITDKEVMNGKVKDKFLAETHMKLSYLFTETMQGDKSDRHLVKAALCGDKDAIKLLEKSGVEY